MKSNCCNADIDTNSHWIICSKCHKYCDELIKSHRNRGRLKMENEKETTLRAILIGVLLNGYFQGQRGEKYNNAVIEEALRQIKKLLKDEVSNGK